MSETMIAAVMPQAGRIEIAEFPIPEMGEDEVLVRMETAAICGSDVHVVYDGWAREDAIGRPGYPGHEGVGEVVASRSDLFAPGDKVFTVPPGWYGGCFAEYQSVQARWLLPLPAGGDRQRLLMAQQLGTTMYGLRKFWSRPSGKVATIFGAGSAGLFFLQQLKQLGFPEIVVVDLNADRLEIAKRLGATRTVHAPEQSAVDVTMEASDGEGADLVIEAAGYDLSREQAVYCVKKFGQVGYFGYPEHYGLSPFPFERAYRKAITIDFIIDTALEPELRSFRDALEAVDEGTIDVGYSLNEVFPLERISEALELAKERGPSIKLRVDLTESRNTASAGEAL